METTDVFLVLCPIFYTKLPPLCLAYLAEHLENNRVGVQCFDLNIQLYQSHNCEKKRMWNVQNNPKLALYITKNDINNGNPIFRQFLEQINIRKPKIISFSLFKSNLIPTIECIKVVKNRYPEAKIVCGGPEVGHLLKKTGAKALKTLGIDGIILGEGEKALTLLAKNWHDNRELVILERHEAESLDAIPSPSFSQLDRNSYDTRNTIPMLMSRGCIRRCHFCSERLLYDGYRVCSAEHVIAEMEHHISNGITSFVFHDSLINGDLGGLERLCVSIIDKGLNIAWEAQCVVRNDMPLPLLLKIKQAGCYNLFVGLESASDAVLKRMNKGITVEEVLVFFKKCKEAGLHFEISLITNFPGESDEEFQETCDFLIENKELIPKIAQVNPYVPYEGTITGENEPIVDESRGQAKMNLLVQLFENEGIPFTKSYIGNLLPR